jgi:hypothetical protein
MRKNENRWIDGAVWEDSRPLPSNMQEHVQARLNRPVNPDYHKSKGSKFDVPFPSHLKVEYLADRLGHPETVGTPLERLLKLESDLYHPAFLDQPYVHMPKSEPNPSLNFARGPIVYENKRVAEWTKLGYYGLGTTLVTLAGYIPFVSFYKSNGLTPSANENLFIPFHNFSIHYIDAYKIHVPLAALIISYVFYISMWGFSHFAGNYAQRLVLSQDEELLFVTVQNRDGKTSEKVFEMAHLEILPPGVKAGLEHLSSQREDGIWRITCQNSLEEIWVYNDDRCWNPDLKKSFLRRVSNLWTSDLGRPYQPQPEVETAGQLPK